MLQPKIVIFMRAPVPHAAHATSGHPTMPVRSVPRLADDMYLRTGGGMYPEGREVIAQRKAVLVAAGDP